MNLGGIASIGGGLLGAIAGGQKDKQSTTNNTSTRVDLQSFDDLNKGRSGLETDAYNSQVSSFQDLLKLVQGGPGQAEVDSNLSFQNSFAKQLQAMLGKIGNQTQADVQNNFGQAQQLFAPQQTALNQQFADQTTASNRLSARLGRAGNDPIMRNKLMQEQTRQQTMLNSQIGSYGQQLPQIQAQQAVELGGALSNLRGGLASQALQNRQTLMGMGNQLAQAERNYRLQAAGRTTNSLQETIDGGGFKGAVGGLLGGAGMGAQTAGYLK